MVSSTDSWVYYSITVSTNQHACALPDAVPSGKSYIETPKGMTRSSACRRRVNDTIPQRPEQENAFLLFGDPQEIWSTSTRWAPSSYIWSYNPYKWPYKWLTVLITLVIGVINPVITGRGPTLQDLLQQVGGPPPLGYHAVNKIMWSSYIKLPIDSVAGIKSVASTRRPETKTWWGHLNPVSIWISMNFILGKKIA